MIRFFIVWSVFSFKNAIGTLYALRRYVSRAAIGVLRKVLRYGHIPGVLAVARLLCAMRITGRAFRLQNAVATENFRCLTGQSGRINAAWIAVRRRLLEEAATWGQNRGLLRQIQACATELDAVVAPLHREKTPVILAPLHAVSDVLAAMVAASVTPGKASVVVSSSAEIYNQRARAMGGISLSYCSIHQENKALASNLMSLIADVAAGQQNMIIFPDISPDYTVHAQGAPAAKLPCRLFGRAAKLHNGVVRLSGVISAPVVFYHLYYDRGLKIHIYPPVAAKTVANALPCIIEQTLRQHPQEWLLWHSHSLYFINH
ncbi:lysophospholipid acyltransferase family protein [Erwinia tasmaniensis]|uniref:Probable ABC transporter unit n=1 Tax=Erwinia tasmaniensis (strain DSM 17950 / CFBP 7177 / CIP 109463 / NCPPB 4357 / Et1/99) TaxID=465817 RepID=B2VCR8_ERWT9|nr:ABC transporter [Erwinia tasmaniensis]CAO98059.1 Probable ABC transporter unit [Erwinia tasmaniensis Et1/99]